MHVPCVPSQKRRKQKYRRTAPPTASKNLRHSSLLPDENERSPEPEPLCRAALCSALPRLGQCNPRQMPRASPTTLPASWLQAAPNISDPARLSDARGAKRVLTARPFQSPASASATSHEF